MIVKINGIPFNTAVPVDVPNTPSVGDIPWWDLKDQIIQGFNEVGEHINQSVHNFLHSALISTLHFIGVALPTFAVIGILWWMCPFFPKSDTAPKITGLSLFLYMFFVMLGGESIQ